MGHAAPCLALLLVFGAATAPRAALAEGQPPGGAAAEASRARRRAIVRERNAGLVLAGVGLATVAVGGVLLGSSFAGDLLFAEGATARVSGLIGLAAGIVLLVPGVVLAVHGQNQLAELDWRLKHLTWTPLLAPSRDGVFVGVRRPF